MQDGDGVTIQVGDKIQFSTELLKEIDKMTDRHTETVTVEEIREEDGFKTIVLGRIHQ